MGLCSKTSCRTRARDRLPGSMGRGRRPRHSQAMTRCAVVLLDFVSFKKNGGGWGCDPLSCPTALAALGGLDMCCEEPHTVVQGTRRGESVRHSARARRGG